MYGDQMGTDGEFLFDPEAQQNGSSVKRKSDGAQSPPSPKKARQDVKKKVSPLTPIPGSPADLSSTVCRHRYGHHDFG